MTNGLIYKQNNERKINILHSNKRQLLNYRLLNMIGLKEITPNPSPNLGHWSNSKIKYTARNNNYHSITES